MDNGFRRLIGVYATGVAIKKLSDPAGSEGPPEGAVKSSDERTCIGCGQRLDGVLSARCYDCSAR